MFINFVLIKIAYIKIHLSVIIINANVKTTIVVAKKVIFNM